MRYEHIVKKMSEPLRELIYEQVWCRPWIEQGKELWTLLTDEPHLRTLLQRHMSKAETQTLHLIVSAFGSEPFTQEKLDQQAGHLLSGAEVKMALTGLRRSGVIAAFRKAWGEQLFALPEDGFRVWAPLLNPEIRLQTLAEESGLILQETASANPRGIAQQLFHFLVASYQQTPLTLTAKGTLHKKQLQKLSDHLVIPPQTMIAAGLSYAFRDVYNEGTAILLEMAIRLQIFMHEGTHYQINRPMLFQWLHTPYEEQQAHLYGIWRQLVMPAPVWLQHGILLMDQTASHLWYRLEDVVSGIASCILAASPKMNQEAIYKGLMEQWIEPLCLFGWLELAKDEQGLMWFRWQIAKGPANESTRENCEDCLETSSLVQPNLYVQPDFELLLPPDVPHHLEWEIAAFAELQTSDLVRTYRMTKDSFHRAIESGMKSEYILHILQTHACYGVPEHLSMTLQQWGRQAGKLYVEEVTLLRCESSDIADALIRNEKSSPFLQNRLGALDFIIQPEHLPTVKKVLDQIGYHPRRAAGQDARTKTAFLNKDDLSEPDTIKAKPQGLFYSRDSLQLYDIERELPNCDDLYPNMGDIPPLWLKEFRDYHGSTRKEMIRKAIEWNSRLQLRQQGRDRSVIPKAIHEERSGWTLRGVEGCQEITLHSDDWEEMKLILPGINDEEKRETL
ncbi:helicase-associated domain-containing protein [Paenibacillus sp. SI8]|uniref:helicase-associated domain-containing protein n=1 Tax=unclassified Paenibacillus TaxID=185978 RepID=UPI003467ECC8